MPHKCTCVSEYQDSVYGAGVRYHNIRVPKNPAAVGLRCTVCGAEKEVAASKKKDD